MNGRSDERAPRIRRRFERVRPLSPRHRAASIATYAPVLAYLVVSTAWLARRDGAFAWEHVLESALTLSGPCSVCCFAVPFLMLPAFPIPVVAAVVVAIVVTPFFVLARHDVGTMPWPWFLALASTWVALSASFWTWRHWL